MHYLSCKQYFECFLAKNNRDYWYYPASTKLGVKRFMYKILHRKMMNVMGFRIFYQPFWIYANWGSIQISQWSPKSFSIIMQYILISYSIQIACIVLVIMNKMMFCRKAAAILDLCKLGTVPHRPFWPIFDMLFWTPFWNALCKKIFCCNLWWVLHCKIRRLTGSYVSN